MKTRLNSSLYPISLAYVIEHAAQNIADMSQTKLLRLDSLIDKMRQEVHFVLNAKKTRSDSVRAAAN